MTFEPTTIILAILAGLAAGVINTFAGNGSAITLGVLTEFFGLPVNVANGTNRVGILMQGVSSSYSFIKNDKLDLMTSRWPIVVSFIGAICGVILVLQLDNDFFFKIYRYLLVLMLFVILINPKRWFNETREMTQYKPYTLPLFFLVGFYGGFIQMGMGVFFLISTVVIMKYNFVRANALKTFIVASYTIVVISIFHYKGLVDWRIGGTIGIGQATGGYLAAEFLSKYPRSQYWAYAVLLIMIVIVILSTYDIVDLSL